MNSQLPSEEINLIEIRAAKNGYVISAWRSRPYSSDHVPRGYESYVCEAAPGAVGRVVEAILRDLPMTQDLMMPPARQLP